MAQSCCLSRVWWNWQTRYFEVVVGKPVQVQVLLRAPAFARAKQRGKAAAPKPIGEDGLRLGWPVAEE